MQVPPHPSRATIPEAQQLETALFELKRVIVGQERAIERLFVCLLSQGHCLLEGVPGLAKTLAMETLAIVSGGSFARIQFTPDLLPADIMGTRIFRASSETFDVELGPVFANFVLADEINRAPAKVQSALLEVMAEHQVSIGGQTYKVPQPFLVLATQNPVEQEGVYPLPEAQRDRFLMKVTVGYPTAAEEVEIVNRMGVEPPVPRQVLDPAQLALLQQAARSVYVDRGVVDYAVSIVLATRDPQEYGLPELAELIDYGASPLGASLGLVAAGRALALMRGRRYALPQDVFDVAPEILRHRLVLSYEAIAQGLAVDQVSARVLSTVPAPRVAPSQDPVDGAAAWNRVDIGTPLVVTAPGPTPTFSPPERGAVGGGGGAAASGGSEGRAASPGEPRDGGGRLRSLRRAVSAGNETTGASGAPNPAPGPGFGPPDAPGPSPAAPATSPTPYGPAGASYGAQAGPAPAPSAGPAPVAPTNPAHRQAPAPPQPPIGAPAPGSSAPPTGPAPTGPAPTGTDEPLPPAAVIPPPPPAPGQAASS